MRTSLTALVLWTQQVNYNRIPKLSMNKRVVVFGTPDASLTRSCLPFACVRMIPRMRH